MNHQSRLCWNWVRLLWMPDWFLLVSLAMLPLFFFLNSPLLFLPVHLLYKTCPIMYWLRQLQPKNHIEGFFFISNWSLFPDTYDKESTKKKALSDKFTEFHHSPQYSRILYYLPGTITASGSLFQSKFSLFSFPFLVSCLLTVPSFLPRHHFSAFPLIALEKKSK